MKGRIPVQSTLRKLVALWGLGLTLVFSVVFAQTIMNLYGEQTSKAWAWLFPNVLPTFSLALGAAIAEESKRTRRTTSRFLANVALLGSGTYLTVVLLTLLVRPFTGRSPIEWITTAGLWLGPLQAAVGASLAVFLSKESAPK